jgi:nucleoside-diphosphate-sugar epimerase
MHPHHSSALLGSMSSHKALVLLTGPNGFVGAHVMSALLDANYRVRGTVRSLTKATYLQRQHPAAVENGDLTFAEVPDIQAPSALDEAARDVDYICHVASPYFISSNDPIKELVEPAVNGTRNVVSSAIKSKSVKKLTILSSFASVIDNTKGARPGYVYTSDDWNPVTMQAATHGGLGYAASKTFAERAAWDMWKEAKSSRQITWDLVTLCPPMIYGPPSHEVDPSKGIKGLNTSLARILTGLQGKDPAFAPKVATPGLPAWVDVRDVAKAHVQGLGLAEGTSGRFLLCGGIDYFEDGLTGLRNRGEKGLGEEGARVDRTQHYSLDRSKAEQDLSIKFRDITQTIEDTWDSCKKLGVI